MFGALTDVVYILFDFCNETHSIISWNMLIDALWLENLCMKQYSFFFFVYMNNFV